MLEAWLLTALAHDRLAQLEASHQALERALDVAERQALVGTVLTVRAAHAPPERHPRHRTAPFIAQALGSLAAVAADGHNGHLLEPLTERARVVPRFRASNLSAAEIASALFLSLHTVTTHTRHI